MKNMYTFGFALTVLAMVFIGTASNQKAAEGLKAGAAASIEEATATVETNRTAEQCCRFERLEARNQFRIARLNHEMKMMMAKK